MQQTSWLDWVTTAHQQRLKLDGSINHISS
jgi:hypothetical protein